MEVRRCLLNESIVVLGITPARASPYLRKYLTQLIMSRNPSFNIYLTIDNYLFYLMFFNHYPNLLKGFWSQLSLQSRTNRSRSRCTCSS